MGKKVYITESELRNIVENSVKQVLNENQQDESLLGLAALAGGSYLYGKAKQRGETPFKNAYNWAKSKINGTDYNPQVQRPQGMSSPDAVKQFQIKALTDGKYRNGDNIVVGKWGPKESEIYQSNAQPSQNDSTTYDDVEF